MKRLLSTVVCVLVLFRTSLIGGTNDVTSTAPQTSGLVSPVDGWSVIIDDNFTRPDTTPPASLGGPAVFAAPSTGGEWIDGTCWVDQTKTWRILNNALVPTLTGHSTSLTGPVRPAEENVLNQGAELTTGPLPASDTITSIPYTLLLRIVPGGLYGSAYGLQLILNPKDHTAVAAMADAAGGGIFNTINGHSIAVQTGHSYVLTGAAQSLYNGGFTLLSYSVADAAAPSRIIDSGQSYVLPMNLAFLSQPGAIGVQQERSDNTRSDLDVITRFRSFAKPIKVLNSLAAPLVKSTNGTIVTISGEGTHWTPGLPGDPKFTLSGRADCSIASQEVLSPTLARLTLTTGTSTGHLQVEDPSTGGTYDLQVGPAVAPLVVMNLVPVVSDPNTVKILAGVVTGGRPPYTYQWHRSTDWSFTPNDSTRIANATKLDLVDTPPGDACYAYKLVVTDSTPVTPLTVTSPSAPGMRNWRPVPDPVYQPSNHVPALRIGWIGDSLTATGTKNVATTLPYITAAGVTIESSTNCGHSGAYTGAQDNGWQPTAPTGYYTDAVAAFKAANVNVIMMMLGTNDSQSFGVATETYITNLNTILAHLAIDLPGVPVVLNTPALATRKVSEDPNDRQIALVDALDRVVAANKNAVRGDRNMPEWSYGRYDEYLDGIHPNDRGSDSYARYWADALLRYEDSAHP